MKPDSIDIVLAQVYGFQPDLFYYVIVAVCKLPCVLTTVIFILSVGLGMVDKCVPKAGELLQLFTTTSPRTISDAFLQRLTVKKTNKLFATSIYIANFL
jgi:hypothetical protein